MTPFHIQILFIILLFMYQPLEILLTRKRHGIYHASSFPWAFVASLLSLSNLRLQPEEQNTEYFMAMIGLILAIVIIVVVTKIFNGYSYKVVDVAGLNLKITLQKAIESTGMKVSEIDVVADNKKNDFIIANSKRRMSIEIKEKFLSNETYYILKFDRWVDRKTRHDILDYISEQMTHLELPKKKMRFKLIEAALFIAVLIVALGFFNARWLQDTKYAIFEDEGMPEVLNVTAFDKRIVQVKQDKTIMISDPTIIQSFYEEFSDGYLYLNTSDELSDFSNKTYYRISYGKLSQSIYVTSDRCYMYITFDAIRETSTVNRLMVDFFRLYSKKEGLLYYLNYDFSELQAMRTLLKGEL
jgi:hypothetical protein